MIAERFGLDVEIDVIVEALADTRSEIAAVRLGAAEQTKTHVHVLRASQPAWAVGWLSFARRELGIAILLERRSVWKGLLQI